jgi:hypothetical protein
MLEIFPSINKLADKHLLELLNANRDKKKKKSSKKQTNQSNKKISKKIFS